MVNQIYQAIKKILPDVKWKEFWSRATRNNVIERYNREVIKERIAEIRKKRQEEKRDETIKKQQERIRQIKQNVYSYQIEKDISQAFT